MTDKQEIKLEFNRKIKFSGNYLTEPIIVLTDKNKPSTINIIFNENSGLIDPICGAICNSKYRCKSATKFPRMEKILCTFEQDVNNELLKYMSSLHVNKQKREENIIDSVQNKHLYENIDIGENIIDEVSVSVENNEDLNNNIIQTVTFRSNNNKSLDIFRCALKNSSWTPQNENGTDEIKFCCEVNVHGVDYYTHPTV